MPAITYYTLTPLASDSISSTQPKINQNFIGTNAWTAVDHEEFASPNAGFHKQVRLISQGGAPSFNNATDLGMWNSVGSVSGKQEIYLAKTTNNSRINVAITESSLSTGALPNQASGYTMLPSGMIMRFDTATITLPGVGSLGEKTISFSSSFPNACFKVFITLRDNAVNAGLIAGIKQSGGINASQFIVSFGQTMSGTGNVDFTYLAIGY
jgi:hypothetical protein